METKPKSKAGLVLSKDFKMNPHPNLPTMCPKPSTGRLPPQPPLLPQNEWLYTIIITTLPLPQLNPIVPPNPKYMHQCLQNIPQSLSIWHPMINIPLFLRPLNLPTTLFQKPPKNPNIQQYLIRKPPPLPHKSTQELTLEVLDLVLVHPPKPNQSLPTTPFQKPLKNPNIQLLLTPKPPP